MARGSWRDEARPLVAEAIEAGRSLGLEGRDLAKYCAGQFPWGVRRYHPYRIWLDEVRQQLRIRRKRKAERLPLFDEEPPT